MLRSNEWEILHKRTKEFIKLLPLNYHGVDIFHIPKTGGIYLITLKEESGEETSLYLHETDIAKHQCERGINLLAVRRSTPNPQKPGVSHLYETKLPITVLTRA